MGHFGSESETQPAVNYKIAIPKDPIKSVW